jgi:hypothetical protein
MRSGFFSCGEEKPKYFNDIKSGGALLSISANFATSSDNFLAILNGPSISQEETQDVDLPWPESLLVMPFSLYVYWVLVFVMESDSVDRLSASDCRIPEYK